MPGIHFESRDWLEDYPFLADWVSSVTRFSHSDRLCLNVEALTLAAYNDFDPDPTNVPDQLHVKVDMLTGDHNGAASASVFELHFTVGPARMKLTTELLVENQLAQIVVHLSANITFNVTVERGHCQQAKGQFEGKTQALIYLWF